MLEKMKRISGNINSDEGEDEETIRMVERMAVLRIATKHVNLWTRQLEMKRDERAGL